jgi:Zn finger protein HypA/HybF involved in hydrogenase expression
MTRRIFECNKCNEKFTPPYDVVQCPKCHSKDNTRLNFSNVFHNLDIKELKEAYFLLEMKG